MVTSRGRTRVALLRLALCYSGVPLRSTHKPIPYEDIKRMCQSNQPTATFLKVFPARLESRIQETTGFNKRKLTIVSTYLAVLLYKVELSLYDLVQINPLLTSPGILLT